MKEQGKNSDVSGVASSEGDGRAKSGRGRTFFAFSDFQTLPHSSQPRTNEGHNLLDVIPTKLRASAYKSVTLRPELILCHSLLQLLYLSKCNIAEGQPSPGVGGAKL
jgi:hypothetical protein